VLGEVISAIADPKAAKEGVSNKAKAEQERAAEINKTGSIFENVRTEIESTLTATVLKYKHDIVGVIKSLSGAPSTPWHITIGNPLRPVFCSGDMLVEDVKLSTGPDLAFNDLPARIKVEFTMKNSRPWGLQEIAGKFATGHLRTVNTIRDFSTMSPGQTLHNSPLEYNTEDADNNGVDREFASTKGDPERKGVPNDVDSTNGASTVSNTTAGNNNSNTGVTTENKTTSVVNSDAGSGSEPNPVITEGNNTNTPAQQQAINNNLT
jgi:hypothetical protein